MIKSKDVIGSKEASKELMIVKDEYLGIKEKVGYAF